MTSTFETASAHGKLHRRHVTVALVAALVQLLTLAGIRESEADAYSYWTFDTTLVSRAGGLNGPAADGDSSAAYPSESGRYVAFTSQAKNLHPATGGSRVATHVFRRDVTTGEVQLISRASGAGGTAANGESSVQGISRDGRYVVFLSRATNLSGAGQSTLWKVFLRDTQAHTTVLASRASGSGGAAANSNSSGADVSDDGRYVAFATDATNLHSGTGGLRQVFVRDTVANATTLESRWAADGQPADGHSWHPSISGDGTYVAFASEAGNLSGNAVPGVTNIYRRTRTSDNKWKIGVHMVSRKWGEFSNGGNGDSLAPRISRTGRYVVFESWATDLVSGIDPDAKVNVFIRDVPNHKTSLVSRASGAGGAGANGLSYRASVSDDGRHVAFVSGATNLHPDAPTGQLSVYHRDRQTKATRLASRASGAGGAPANKSAGRPEISPGGKYVVFSSKATNLSTADLDGTDDVFRRDVLGKCAAKRKRAAGSKCSARSGREGRGRG